jgi:hypothetical protein
VRSFGMEKDQIDGFILEASAVSNVAAGAGVTHARFIAVAESTDDAIWLVGKLPWQPQRPDSCYGPPEGF